MAIDLRELLRRKRQVLQRRDAIVDLAGRLAPISAEVTRGSRSTQAIAICASD